MIPSWRSSYPSRWACKTATILLGLSLPFAGIQAENRLLLSSGAGHVGPLSWQSVDIRFEPEGVPEAGARWRLEAEGLEFAGWSGSLHLDCADGGVRGARPWCRTGRFEWRDANEQSVLAGRLGRPDDGPGFAFEVDDAGLSGLIQWPSQDEAGSVRGALRFDGFELDNLPEPLLDRLGLSVFEGRLDGRAEFARGRLDFALDWLETAFDGADGRVAGADLSLTLEGAVEGLVGAERARFDANLSQRAGELLLGPVYLPPPERPLEVELSGELTPGERLQVESLSFDDGGVARVEGGLRLEATPHGWRLAELVVEQARFDFPEAWGRWGDGPAAAWGLTDLATEGVVEGALAWGANGLERLDLRLDDVRVRDASERFAFESLDGRLRRTRERLETDLSWDGLELFRLAFGPARLVAEGTPEAWHLARPLELPLLDGGVAIDRLNVATDENGEPAVTLDARIEPLDLAELTGMLGLARFGGQLSGGFPGVRVSGGEIAFAGGIDIRAFSGGIRIGDLVIERPFGTLPALAAQVEIERLDLAELTGAFNFGHMEGELSGWMRDLRLLDWRPVAMDARLYTHEDAASRRISQRAVENLSRLGGGAAAIGATVLRMFEEFPYRRAGLACRLDRNICHIDGVAPHPSGGFYIVEGRGLPHLDVVGHRRLVDWPRLVAQLVAMTKG